MQELNTALFFSIYNLSHQNPVLDWIGIFSAEILIYVMYGLVLYWAFHGQKSEKKAALLIFVSLLVAAIVIKVLRIFLIEQRPFVTHEIQPLVTLAASKSFPSIHTTQAAIIAWSYLFCHSRKAVAVFIMAFLVGFSRIFVGVHYPFDVVGGFLIGLLAVFITWRSRSLFLTGPTTSKLK